MKKTLFTLCLLIFTLFSFNISAASPGNTQSKQVVLSYFSALIKGDAIALNNSMGSELHNRQARLLSNPNYPDMLGKNLSKCQYFNYRISTYKYTDC